MADSELIACRERITWLLTESGMFITGYRKKSTEPVAVKSKKRKVEEACDDMYDGIKRLYEENVNASSSDKLVLQKRGSCASEMHHDAEDNQHPFVPPVAAV